MQYERLPKTSRKEVEERLEAAQGEELCLLLLGMSEIEDWRWVQDIYLRYLGNQDQWVAAAAVTGLGHLARVAGELDKEKVVGALKDLALSRPELEGKIKDALSDIDIFI